MTEDQGSLVLVADDQELARKLLGDQIAILGHRPLYAENGLSALAQVRRHQPDLVLLDLMMPEMDGVEALDRLKQDPATQGIPVVVLSALDDLSTVIRCVELGAEDYLPKPVNFALLKARVAHCLEKKKLQDHAERYRRSLEDYNLRLEEEVREKLEALTRAHIGTIFALSKLAESRDPETGAHLERLREFARSLAGWLARHTKYSEVIDQRYIDNLYDASPLHDIGKVGIPDSVLLKPGRLTPDEFEVMKTHTTIGAETLRRVEEHFPGNSLVEFGIEIAESHHEKWDGTGYPRGLRGEDIPLSGRILALADVYDALRSKRVYKDAFSHEKTRGIILEGRGQHFDPLVAEAFEHLEDDFQRIRERFEDPDGTA